jgi:hypothetical protein
MSLQTIQKEFKTEFETYLAWLVANTDRISEVPETASNALPEINFIMFSYPIDDIFEDIKMVTAIRARSIKNQEGKPMLDDYAMTGDETTWFEKELKTGSKRVENAISHMSKNIPTPYLYDEGVNITDYVDTAVTGSYYRYNGIIYKALQDTTNIPPAAVTDVNWEIQSPFTDTKGKVVYFIERNANLPTSSIISMDEGLFMALQLYILKQWYKIVGLMDEASLKEQEYTQAILQIRSDSYVRKKGVVRPATDLSL